MIQRFFFAVVTNQKFDIFIMIIILLNMILMGLEHYEQSEDFEHGLYVVNTAFIIIFTSECILKLISLRLHFFKQAWNVFDFVVVVVSVLGQFSAVSQNCNDLLYLLTILLNLNSRISDLTPCSRKSRT